MHDFVGEFEVGQLVLMKNRASGVFEAPLVGPYEFVDYKDKDKYAAWLKDGDGKVFDCAVSHLVPMYDAPLVKKRRHGNLS